MERDTRPEKAPNEESRLEGEPELGNERVEMRDLVSDGLSDEENPEMYEPPVPPDEETAAEGELIARDRETVEAPDLGAMAESVAKLLGDKAPGEAFDVYAWSDGSVTNGETPPHETAYLVSLFSPDDQLSKPEIADMLAQGLRTAPDDTLAEPRASRQRKGDA